MVRQRIKELRWVDATALTPDPRNWRRHPTIQRETLQAMLDEVGIADAVIARETADGALMLIDGHLRQDMLKGQQVPVLVVDLDEAEAGQVLATLDPIAQMAKADTEALRALIDATQTPVDWDALMPEAVKVDIPPLVDLTEGMAKEARQNNNLSQFHGAQVCYIGIDGQVEHLPAHIVDWLRPAPLEILEEAYRALGSH